MAAASAGNGVFAFGQGAQALLQFATVEFLTADQRAEHRQAKQGDRINFIHGDSSQINRVAMKPEWPI